VSVGVFNDRVVVPLLLLHKPAMDGGMESGGGEGFFNRKTVAGVLVGAASIGIPMLVQQTVSQIDPGVGLPLLALCGVALLAAGALLWSGQRQRVTATSRRWQIIGMGQGWIEARVRNDAGDQILASWHSGGDSDEIHVWPTFRKRTRPRRSEIVEMIFNVDGSSFEWDVPDAGEAGFSLHGQTWRDVEAIKAMFLVMREGESLLLSVPTLGLSARFTLDGAFDTLGDFSTLGEGQAGGTGASAA